MIEYKTKDEKCCVDRLKNKKKLIKKKKHCFFFLLFLFLFFPFSVFCFLFSGYSFSLSVFLLCAFCFLRVASCLLPTASLQTTNHKPQPTLHANRLERGARCTVCLRLTHLTSLLIHRTFVGFCEICTYFYLLICLFAFFTTLSSWSNLY